MIHSEYWLIIELNINFLYIYKKISKFYLQFIYNGVPYLNDDQVCMKNSMDIRHNYVNYGMALARVWNLLHAYVSLSPCQKYTRPQKKKKLDNKMNASRYKKSFYLVWKYMYMFGTCMFLPHNQRLLFSVFFPHVDKVHCNIFHFIFK